ncbi:hypothetical protein HUU40_24380 [candidate division KSB1 bacterium]|nr:hypothetical protein [candidate division KSB1 bacterium]
MTYTENYFDEEVMADTGYFAIKLKNNTTAQTVETAMANQPLSDGSEEFFEQFTPQEKSREISQKNLLLGVGITLGVIAGVGIALWLWKGKKKHWWQRVLDV